MKTIYTKDITKEIKLPMLEGMYNNIMSYVKVDKSTKYINTTWNTKELILTERGILMGEINHDPTALIVHNVYKVEIEVGKGVVTYRVYIEF